MFIQLTWDIRRPITRPPLSSQPFCGRAADGCNPARNGRLQAVPEQRVNPTRAQLPARGGSLNDCATAPGWPGKRRPIDPLALALPHPHQAARPHRTAGTLSSRGSHSRCRLGLRAPMHVCIGCARVAGARQSRRPMGKCAGCARGCRRVPGRSVIARRGQRWSRSARAHWPHTLKHLLALGWGPLPPSCLARPAGARREVRGMVGSAAPPTLALNPQLPRGFGAHSPPPRRRQQPPFLSGALGPPCCAAPCRHGSRRRAARRGAGGQ